MQKVLHQSPPVQFPIFQSDLTPSTISHLLSPGGEELASAFSHAIAALAMGKGIQNKEVSGCVLLLGVICSIVPDCDVIGFYVGIRYGDLWGHRGLTHSLFFAVLLSGALVVLQYRQKPAAVRVSLFLYFFFSTASHGVLDAMTNGGLGVAFFSPFDTTRYFFALRPILVSPIGISEFLTEYGVQVLLSEILWIWFPSCALFVMMRMLQRLWAGRLPQNHHKCSEW